MQIARWLEPSLSFRGDHAHDYQWLAGLKLSWQW
jgi:hypothetical protein